MCTGLEVVAISAVVTATAAVGTGVANYIQAQDAAAAQKQLERDQAARLQAQQAQAAALAAKEATSGSTFGFSETNPEHKAVMTGLGFGGAPASSANKGSNSVSGMG